MIKIIENEDGRVNFMKLCMAKLISNLFINI